MKKVHVKIAALTQPQVESWKGFKALTQKNLKFNSTRQVKLNIGSEVPTLTALYYKDATLSMAKPAGSQLYEFEKDLI